MHNILLNLTELEAEFSKGKPESPRVQDVRLYVEYLNQQFIRSNHLAQIYYRQIPGDIVGFFDSFVELDEAMIIFSGMNISPSKQFNFHHGRAHSINCFEGVWMYSGEADFFLDGETYHLQEGDFLMHAPGHMYEFITSKDAIGINLMLRKNYILEKYTHLFSGNLAAIKFFEAAIRKEYGKNHLIFHAGPGQKALNEIICHIFIEYLWGDTYQSAIMDHYFEIFISLLRRFADNAVQSPHRIFQSERYFDEITEYITANFRTATLEDAAAKVHLSKQYICRILRNTADQSFSQLLVAEKLKKAKEYLLETDLVIENIAELTGFSSASHFSRVFKEIEKITPSDFRKTHRT